MWYTRKPCIFLSSNAHMVLGDTPPSGTDPPLPHPRCSIGIPVRPIDIARRNASPETFAISGKHANDTVSLQGSRPQPSCPVSGDHVLIPPTSGVPKLVALSGLEMLKRVWIITARVPRATMATSSRIIAGGEGGGGGGGGGDQDFVTRLSP